MKLAPSAALLVLLAALATSSALAQKPAAKPAAKSGSSLQATLEKLEKDGWDAFKNKDKKAYSALCTPDYTAVFADGSVHDLNGALESMKDLTLNRYTLSDLKLTSLGAEAAVLTYRAAINLTVGQQKPQDMNLAVTDVWVKRGGQWKAIRYHESPAK